MRSRFLTVRSVVSIGIRWSQSTSTASIVPAGSWSGYRSQLPNTQKSATRWSNGRFLILLRTLEYGNGERLRLAVAPGLQLLFEDGLLAGWILEGPERWIPTLKGDASPNPADPELAEILAEYLHLMAFPTLDSLAEGDLGFKRVLEELVERLEANVGATDRRASLSRVINDVLQYWYE